MLIQDYSYYLIRIIGDGLLSIFGILSILLLIGAFAALLKFDAGTKLRVGGFWVLLALAITSFLSAFYSATYEFDERPETIVLESLPAGEPNCGTKWTGWIKGAYGMGNPCDRDCYRGNVLRKQMRMSGFPPWPEYKRELQCWKREAGDENDLQVLRQRIESISGLM